MKSKYYRYEVIQNNDRPSDIVKITISKEEYINMKRRYKINGGWN